MISLTTNPVTSSEQNSAITKTAPNWLSQARTITGLAAFTIGSLALFAYQTGYFFPSQQPSQSQFNNQTQCSPADKSNEIYETCPIPLVNLANNAVTSLSIPAISAFTATIANYLSAFYSNNQYSLPEVQGVSPQPFSVFASENKSSRSNPKTSLLSKTWNYVADYWNDFQLTYLPTPDATQIRKHGEQFLASHGTSLPNTEPSSVDLEYRANWEKDEQCPLSSDYAKHLFDRNSFNGFRIDSLRALYGNKRDLSDKETRQLYKHLIDAESKVPADKNCLNSALVASQIRTSARLYTRERMLNEDEAQLLQKRDQVKYGTKIPDPAYMAGKCVGQASSDHISDVYNEALSSMEKEKNHVKKVCECLGKGAQKTSYFYDLVSKIFG